MIGSYMTVAEVAEKLGKTKATITRALVKLGAQKVSGVYLINEKTFNACKSQPKK